jgi:type IV secretion system protein VirB5
LTNTPPVANPYLNARREWDERYGDLITRAKNWRVVAMASIAVAGLACAGIVYIGAQSKIQPFVVMVDQLGSPVAVARPASMSKSTADQRIKVAQIANWVVNARTITSDRAAQQVMIDKVYAMAGRTTAEYLNTWYRDHPPFGGDETVSVEIISVLPQSADTYQVSWNETRSKHGQTAKKERWKSLLTVAQSDELANDPGVALWNPFGLYVKEMSWTKEIE